MTSPRYLSGDDVADAKNAHGMGVSLERIAGQLGCSVQELRAAMGLPQSKPEPAEYPCDLWRTDDLQEVL